MSRNIFYISNVQSDLFPHNIRTKFDQYIEVNNLNYIKHDDSIEVAVKAISFDNKQILNIVSNIYKPHFILTQPISFNIEAAKGDTIVRFSDGGEKIIDIESANNFQFINHCEVKDSVIIKSNENRNFSNLMIVTQDNCIIHNIYMHQKECFYLDTFINDINSVLKSVTFYDKITKIDTNLVNDNYELNGLSVGIHIHEDIASVLGIYTEKIVGNNLEDCIDKGIFEDLNCNTFMKNIYKKEQTLVYYKVDSSISSLKIKPKLFHDTLYGIRSNISDPSICSAQYDTLISVFKDCGKQDVLNIVFENPCFFKTRKELLSRAHFNIVDLDSKQNNQKLSIGAPTYIHTIVKEVPFRMKRPFTIFLDSSCSTSNKLHPQNTNMDFIIELPERLNFRRDWTVTLKTLFLSNKIQNMDDCICRYTLFDSNTVALKDKRFTLKNGSYSTLASILHQMSEEFKKYAMPFSIEEVHSGRVKIKHTTKIKEGNMLQLTLNKHLACILGYISSPNNHQTLRFDQHPEYIAPHNPNLFLRYPKNLIIGCNIVDNTIFGGQHVKLLRLITNSDNLNSDILSFEFLQDEKVNLGIREFKSIHISIMDTTGSIVKSESKLSSRLQLMFSLD